MSTACDNHVLIKITTQVEWVKENIKRNQREKEFSCAEGQLREHIVLISGDRYNIMIFTFHLICKR